MDLRDVKGNKWLEISEELLSDFVGLAHVSSNLKTELEYSAFAVGTYENNIVKVTDYYFPRQVNSVYDTTIKENAEADFNNWLYHKMKDDPKIRRLGWFHSHTTKFSAEFSSTDEKTMEKHQEIPLEGSSAPMVDIVFGFNKLDKTKEKQEIDFQYALYSISGIDKQRVFKINPTIWNYKSVNTPSEEKLKELSNLWKNKVAAYIPPKIKKKKETTTYVSAGYTPDRNNFTLFVDLLTDIEYMRNDILLGDVATLYGLAAEYDELIGSDFSEAAYKKFISGIDDIVLYNKRFDLY